MSVDSRLTYKDYEKLLKENCSLNVLDPFNNFSKPSQRKVLDEEVRRLLGDLKLKKEKLAEIRKKRSKQDVRARKMKKVCVKISEDTQKVLRRESPALATLERLKETEVSPEVVRFNVSGKTVFTTTETLSKEPCSLLYALAAHVVECPRDASGSVFLDKNPAYFEAIIEYLRSGWYDKDGDSYFTKKLYKEALYFGISSLVREMGGVLLDSVFGLQFYETKALTEWCEAKSFTLLYRASRDGFDAKSFHSSCDNIKGTLTIIKTVTGCIFGGYTEVGWSPKEKPTIEKGSGHEFLFTLRNPQSTGPIQFPVRFFNKYKSVLHCKRYGPSFGANAKGHCEIHIAEKPNENINSHVLGFPAMYDGKGYDNKIFCGSERFQVEDYEVFLVTNERTENNAFVSDANDDDDVTDIGIDDGNADSTL